MSRAALSAALDREIDRWCREPMRWGIDDCALSAANVIRQALGYDPAEAWRASHGTRDEAYRVVGRMGLGFAVRRVARAYGWGPIAPEQADVGDIGLIMQDGRPCVVICKARGWFMGRSETGASLLPVENTANPCMSVRIAWSVLP